MIELQARFGELAASITVLAERADVTSDLARLLAIHREAERVRDDCDTIILTLSRSGEIGTTRACLRTARLTGLALAQIRARVRFVRNGSTGSGSTTVVS